MSSDRARPSLSGFVYIHGLVVQKNVVILPHHFLRVSEHFYGKPGCVVIEP